MYLLNMQNEIFGVIYLSMCVNASWDTRLDSMNRYCWIWKFTLADGRTQGAECERVNGQNLN